MADDIFLGARVDKMYTQETILAPPLDSHDATSTGVLARQAAGKPERPPLGYLSGQIVGGIPVELNKDERAKNAHTDRQIPGQFLPPRRHADEDLALVDHLDHPPSNQELAEEIGRFRQQRQSSSRPIRSGESYGRSIRRAAPYPTKGNRVKVGDFNLSEIEFGALLEPFDDESTQQRPRKWGTAHSRGQLTAQAPTTWQKPKASHPPENKSTSLSSGTQGAHHIQVGEY